MRIELNKIIILILGLPIFLLVVDGVGVYAAVVGLVIFMVLTVFTALFTEK